MEKLSLRKKAALAGVGVLAATTGGAAWAYVTGYGVGTGQATVAAAPPSITGSSYTGALIPDVPSAITVTVHNPLDTPVEITRIPVGTSAEATGCPAASVMAGVFDGAGNLVAEGDGVTAIVRSDTPPYTAINPHEDGQFNLWGLFDTASFPVGDAANDQNGCVGTTVTLDFDAVSFHTVGS